MGNIGGNFFLLFHPDLRSSDAEYKVGKFAVSFSLKTGAGYASALKAVSSLNCIILSTRDC